MGIWRVAHNAPGRSDSPSSVLRRRTPSRTPPESLVKTKSVSSVNDSATPIEKRKDYAIQKAACIKE
eukprot:119089-Pelagomonas_calceolata.AAC.1